MPKSEKPEGTGETDRLEELEAALKARDEKVAELEEALKVRDAKIEELEALAVTSHEGAKHVVLVKGDQKTEVHPSTVKAHLAAGWKYF